MPVSKTELFSESELKIAIIGRALAHPARVRIFKLIQENGFVKNCDLISLLGLTKSSVFNHVVKLRDAGLVQIVYKPNHFQISLIKDGFGDIKSFVESID